MRKVIASHLERLQQRGTLSGLSPSDLLTRFLNARDEEAFSALVDRFGPMVLGVCRATLGDGIDADDAFQATFLLLVRKAHLIQHHERLGAWLHSVARRVSVRARRTRKLPIT